MSKNQEMDGVSPSGGSPPLMSGCSLRALAQSLTKSHTVSLAVGSAVVQQYILIIIYSIIIFIIVESYQKLTL